MLLWVLVSWVAPAVQGQFSGPEVATERARQMVENFRTRGEPFDPSVPPRSPDETVASFKLMEGLEAEAVLHEPIVTQPLFINFDERGRLWLVQYIQYPYPAGLKIVDFGDQFHAAYDKVPPPPPHNDRGADRISIHEDTDGDGVYDSHKVFLEGLNMVSAVERGRGGVWVLNAPYLLFYPDLNMDDVPDTDPVVHLAGFGLEDTHSVANSLCWGPDGWLWGVQGSGVSSNIVRPGIDEPEKGLTFKGAVAWRYHPEDRAFELFAQGGGNSFTLPMDSEGRVFTGRNGSNHRGYHFVQGGYYIKHFGEHGYFTNQNTYGFFGPMEHNWDSPRFSQTMIFYEEGRLGPAFQDRFIVPNALGNNVFLTERLPQGSTYRTKDIGMVLESDDRWFRPVDTKVGPDGAVYLADWYDIRLSHMDPRDNWDRKHGRVYRIQAEGASPQKGFDLSRKSSGELVELLDHEQAWFRKTALRLLADRRDRSVIEVLRKRVSKSENLHALDYLWGLHAVGGFEPSHFEALLQHPQSAVRLWTIRLMCDREREYPANLTGFLRELAAEEPDAQVRSQLASSLRRMPAKMALPVLAELLGRAEDVKDPHIPLLLWWALEQFAETNREQVVELFEETSFWRQPLVRRHVIHRLARRYASFPSTENQHSLSQLASSAPDESGRDLLRQGLAEAFQGRGIDQLTPELADALLNSRGGSMNPLEIGLGVKRGDPKALMAALAFVVREDPELRADRIRVIEAMADAKVSEAIPSMLELVGGSSDAQVRRAALSALGKFDDPSTPENLLALWSKMDESLRRQTLNLLISRPSWAYILLRSTVGKGWIPKADVPDSIVDGLRLYKDEKIQELIDRYFGKKVQTTSEEKSRQVSSMLKLLTSGAPGEAPSGRTLFDNRCGTCHKLFGRGEQIGPDLTGYERTNLDYMLVNTVDPNAGIREGFRTFQVETKDGRILMGFVESRDSTKLVLRDLAGQLTTISVEDIATEMALPTSLMPEGLLKRLTEKELRDLFAYLTSPTAP